MPASADKSVCRPAPTLALGPAACLALLLALVPAGAGVNPPSRPTDRAEADALFTNGVLLHLRIEITESNLARLRRQPRQYVPATLREGDQVYPDVAVHLKGSAGSFRGVDDKPGLTLNLGTFEAPSRFHGLKKFHLNNSVQDPTYLSEWLCGELFRAAEVPAARVAHALVELNGKKLGLYVLKESFDRDFLARYFSSTRGNLYGQSGGADVSEPLERMQGEGENTRADLKALTAAAREPDPVRRWEQLQRTLDVDRFLSFMALEMMLGHWDGYVFARHNYRIYQDLDTGRMVFFPHDLDQMLGDPNTPVFRGANGLIAQSVLRTPEPRERYRDRVDFLFTNLFQVEVWTNRIDAQVARLRPALAAHHPNLAREFERNAGGLKHRFAQRVPGLARQLGQATPELTLRFQDQIARPGGWQPQTQSGEARLDAVKGADGRPNFWIRAQGNTVASWRTRIALEAGRYRFEGLVRTAGVIPVRDERKGAGAGLRISGNETPRENELAGDAPWQKLAYPFEVVSTGDEVELVCELRASAGEVWFETESLRLVRLK